MSHLILKAFTFLRMSLPFIVNEGKWVSMPLVRGVLFTTCFVPSVVFGEESVGLVGRVVNLGKAQAVGQWQCLRVDFGSAYYINVFVFRTVLKGFVERTVRVAARKVVLRAA